MDLQSTLEHSVLQLKNVPARSVGVRGASSRS